MNQITSAVTGIEDLVSISDIVVITNLRITKSQLLLQSIDPVTVDKTITLLAKEYFNQSNN